MIGSSMPSPPKVLIVFDSSVWIDLIEFHPDTLDKVIRLAQLGVLHLGVPTVVRQEVPPSTEVIAAQKKSWTKRIEELRRCAALLTEEQRDGVMDGSLKSVRNFELGLDDMLEAIKAYKGDPYRDRVIRLFNSNVPVSIPCPKAVNDQVLGWAIQKKKPFGEKNSVADALILFSVCRWATKNPVSEVHFYTLNTKDFSDPTDRRQPHPDIRHLFSPTTNLAFHGDVADLHKHVAGLDPSDFYPEPKPGSCLVCHASVPIEELSCNACGTSYDAWIDEDSYTLTPYREGYLVDAGERLQCSNCGRKTFNVELADVCSYHQHMMSKDD
jgi:hypothetical protein